MGYYRAGDYYRGGGYYRAGGLRIGSFLGGIARTAVRSIPIVGGVAGGILDTFAPSRPNVLTLGAGGGGIPAAANDPRARPKPGARGAIERFLPGGATGFVKSRRMDVANAKAVKRAGRRMEGFLKLAKTIERQLPHRMVRVGATKRCGCK